MKLTITNFIAGAGFLAATVIANHFVTTYVVERELLLYAEQNQPPKIAVFDIEGFVTEKSKAGEDPAKILRHVGLISLAANADNMILIDKKAIITAPEQYSLPELSAKELEASLKAAGKKIPDEEQYLKLFEEKRNETQKMLEELTPGVSR